MHFRALQRWLYVLLPVALCTTLRLSGEIRSPISHTGHSRSWTIQIPPGFGIQFHIRHFESLSSATCVQDYVEIFVERHRLGRFCGNGTSVRSHSTSTGSGEMDSSQLTIEARFMASHLDSRCRHGYHLLPDAKTCDVVDCGSPNSVENGHFTFLTETGTWWKSRIVFICDSEYYSLSSPGEGTFECKANGKWMNQERGDRLPTCEPVCGLPHSPPSLVQRIVGGSMAARGSFPWHVYLQTMVCGGALISDLWLLTSATCVEPAARVLVWAGGVQQNQREEWTVMESAEIHIHPGFSRSEGPQHGFQHDLALVRLRNRLPIGPFLSPVCLPGRDLRFALTPGRVGFVPGFGETERWVESERLMFTVIPVVGSDMCSQRANGLQNLTTNMLCAGPGLGSGLGGGDTCHGDGGGAYVFQDPRQKGQFYVGGVVSWGYECGSYSIFTDVNKYLDWIENVMSVNETEIQA